MFHSFSVLELLIATLLDAVFAALLGMLARRLYNEIVRQNDPLRLTPQRESRFSTLGVKEVLTSCQELGLFIGLLLSSCFFLIVRRNYLFQERDADFVFRVKALLLEHQKLQATMPNFKEIQILLRKFLNTLQIRNQELDELIDVSYFAPSTIYTCCLTYNLWVSVCCSTICEAKLYL